VKRISFILIFFTSCIDPYNPPVIEQDLSVLVIDGFINVTGESTIRLTRSQNIYETNTPIVEIGATLWLEDELGAKKFLTEVEAGKYVLPPQTFQATQYRLSIQTKNSKIYQSDFEPVKISPPIDSLTWTITDDLGVQINVNTHDFGNEKGFYRWNFVETNSYISAYTSAFVFNSTTKSIELRKDNIYNCWRTGYSTDILVESTLRLSKNIVSEFPLRYIKQNSELIRFRYSILVNQYSITEKAFNYWKQLRKNSEDLGTLFGPTPTQLTGNFKSLNDPSETVLGYFYISSVTSKRIFISSTQLPIPSFYETPYSGCEQSELKLADVSNFTGPFLLTSEIPDGFGPAILGYYYSAAQCVDCRLTGGTTTKPDFWP
jgi:hypothetical protein